MHLQIRAWSTTKRKGKLVDGVYEVHVDGRFQGYAPIIPLKEKGLVKRVNACGEVERFLNTDEGKSWFVNNRRFNVY